MSDNSYQKPSMKDFDELAAGDKTGASTQGVIVFPVVLAAVYTVALVGAVYFVGAVAQVGIGVSKVKMKK